MWNHRPYVHCIPNRSKLTPNSCLINQEQALTGARALIRGDPLGEIPDHQIERVMSCGQCEQCNVVLPMTRVYERLQREFSLVADRLENFDWYQWDNDVRRERRLEDNRQRWQRQLRARDGTTG